MLNDISELAYDYLVRQIIAMVLLCDKNREHGLSKFMLDLGVNLVRGFVNTPDLYRQTDWMTVGLRAGTRGLGLVATDLGILGTSSISGSGQVLTKSGQSEYWLRT